MTGGAPHMDKDTNMNADKPVRLLERDVAELQAAAEMVCAVAKMAAPGKDMRELCRRVAALSCFARSREEHLDDDAGSYFALISAVMDAAGIRPY